MGWNKEDLERLAEIRKEMLDLAEEAKDLIRVNGTKFDLERAKAYYLGHIRAALDNGEYVERETLKAYIEDQGYDTDSESFEDGFEDEDEEECEEDDESPEVES